MLRITVHESPDGIVLRLEGRLAGPWVRELELCWRSAQPDVRGRIVTVDLSDVDFVDAAGQRLLGAMHVAGVKLIACTPMLAHMVADITG